MASGRALAHARALWGREPWWAEVFAALGVLLWVASSIVSPSSLADRPGFATALALAPGWAWEMGGLLLAAAQLAALALDHGRARKVMCLAATWWWCCLFLSLMQHDPRAPSAMLYLPPLLANGLSVLRIRRGAGDAAMG